MKLVAILARELRVWPTKAIVITQQANGEVLAGTEDTRIANLGEFEQSTDWLTSRITHPQWQAERERIAMQNKDLPQVNDTNVVEYEQQLWDKVAFMALSKAIGEIEVLEDAVFGACGIAEAFMAERAKRLKK